MMLLSSYCGVCKFVFRVSAIDKRIKTAAKLQQNLDIRKFYRTFARFFELYTMKKIFFSVIFCAATVLSYGEQEPIFYETFDRCIDAEDENYGYTGGNDSQWGGDIAKAIVIYTDNANWNWTECNGAYQCAKVGTSKKQGSATTPQIACVGDVVLTFKAAPWEGDSLLTVSVSGGTADKGSFELPKNKWSDITIKISDVKSGIQITFSSLNKHRFFLDEVKVTPADPDAPAIRVPNGTTMDWGLRGKNYTTTERTLVVKGENLSAEGISVSFDQNTEHLFSVTPTSLPAEGGKLRVKCNAGASAGDMHGAYLVLKGVGSKNGEEIEKRVTLLMEVADLELEGSGVKADPYTVNDRILLAENDGTVWSETLYWVTGYILGAVKRYNDTFDGVCTDDKTSLVLAGKPDETDMDKIVTVQISHDARAALNVVDNPNLIGKQVKVQGILLNDKGKPEYLGKPGVRNVSAKSQYVIDLENEEPDDDEETPAEDDPDPTPPGGDDDGEGGGEEPGSGEGEGGGEQPGEGGDDNPGEGEGGEEGSGEEEGFEEVVVTPNAQPSYNVLGQPVDANYQGVVIREGGKYVQIR